MSSTASRATTAASSSGPGIIQVTHRTLHFSKCTATKTTRPWARATRKVNARNSASGAGFGSAVARQHRQNPTCPTNASPHYHHRPPLRPRPPLPQSALLSHAAKPQPTLCCIDQQRRGAGLLSLHSTFGFQEPRSYVCNTMGGGCLQPTVLTMQDF